MVTGKSKEKIASTFPGAAFILSGRISSRKPLAEAPENATI
jgi:hypothetical protein